jgi:hypothetical protein
MIALVISIVTAALQLAPLGIQTVAGIKALLSQDPAVPPDLQRILADTATDNAATLAAVQVWLAAHPQ